MTAMSAHVYHPAQPKGLGPWLRPRPQSAAARPSAAAGAPTVARQARPSLFTSPGISPLSGLVISAAVSTSIWGLVAWVAWALLS